MAWRGQFSCSLNTALKRRRFKKLFQHMTAKFKTRGQKKQLLRHQAHLFYTTILHASVLISCYLKQQTNHLMTYCHQIGFYSMSKCRIKISQYWQKNVQTVYLLYGFGLKQICLFAKTIKFVCSLNTALKRSVKKCFNIWPRNQNSRSFYSKILYAFVLITVRAPL